MKLANLTKSIFAIVLISSLGGLCGCATHKLPLASGRGLGPTAGMTDTANQGVASYGFGPSASSEPSAAPAGSHAQLASWHQTPPMARNQAARQPSICFT
jgi:hypothetical protein